eukprot:m.17984 g.17984  ORF g.17984 m.17984 type:complete len:91 (+) comp27576_c0_seq3:311-583(+)
MAAQWQTFLVLSLFFCNGDSQFGGFDFGGGGGGLNFDDINNAFNNLGSGGSLSDLKDSFDLSSLTSTYCASVTRRFLCFERRLFFCLVYL